MKQLYSPLLITALVSLFAGCAEPAASPTLIPEIDGDWWQIAGVPDLGELHEPDQQPVDFAIWQAGDGKWQLWSCIRHTKETGATRLFFGWESERLDVADWSPTGIKMRADSSLGETPGGLQAPFVFREEDRWQMFYGDWHRICRAVSPDGKTFERVVRNGTSMTFADPAEPNSRDPMVLRIGDTYYAYYTAHPDQKGAVYVRTTEDLLDWGPSKVVAYGGRAGGDRFNDAECPFVVEYPAGSFVLFRTQQYGQGLENAGSNVQQTTLYRSPDPADFGVDDDRFYLGTLPVAAPEIVRDGEDWYIAALNPDLDGIRMARLRWVHRAAVQ